MRDELGRFWRALDEITIPDSVTERWVADLPAWRRLERAARAGMDQVTIEAVRAIQWQVAEAAALGPQAATGLIAATMGVSDELAASFGRVPAGAVEQLVGQLQEGSPLRTLKGVSSESTTAMQRHLTQGLVRGENSRVIGRRIAQASDMPVWRGQTIARTETHRAYRESNRMAMQANTLVHSWIWSADLSAATCSTCWSYHGEEFDTDTPLFSHPNCRCALLPRVTPPAWMDAPVVEYPRGEDLFAALPESDQRKILGRYKFDAYSEGKITLRDTVHERSSDEWGLTRSTASLSQSLANAR